MAPRGLGRRAVQVGQVRRRHRLVPQVARRLPHDAQAARQDDEDALHPLRQAEREEGAQHVRRDGDDAAALHVGRGAGGRATRKGFPDHLLFDELHRPLRAHHRQGRPGIQGLKGRAGAKATARASAGKVFLEAKYRLWARPRSSSAWACSTCSSRRAWSTSRAQGGLDADRALVPRASKELRGARGASARSARRRSASARRRRSAAQGGGGAQASARRRSACGGGGEEGRRRRRRRTGRSASAARAALLRAQDGQEEARGGGEEEGRGRGGGGGGGGGGGARGDQGGAVNAARASFGEKPLAALQQESGDGGRRPQRGERRRTLREKLQTFQQDVADGNAATTPR